MESKLIKPRERMASLNGLQVKQSQSCNIINGSKPQVAKLIGLSN
jgi:hypothetical protein